MKTKKHVRIPRGIQIVCIIAIIGCSVGAVVSAEGVGTVLSASGEGSILRDGRTIPLVTGKDLHPGDTVTTSPNGQATLVLPSGETQSVVENSSISIADTTEEEGRLGRLWSAVRAKFSAGDETHAALGTLGAVRAAPEQPVLEDYEYYDSDEELHREVQAQIEELLRTGEITERDAALLKAVVAEEYERYATAFHNYYAAMSDTGRKILDRSDDFSTDTPISDWDRSIAILITDLYVATGYYDEAAAISDRFSLR